MGRYRREQLLAGIDRVLSGETAGQGPENGRQSAPDPSGVHAQIPESVQQIRSSVLPQLYAHASVDKVPPGSRLSAIKKAMVALVRPFAGRQAAFNHEAVRVLELLTEEVVSNAYRHALDAAALADRDRTIAKQWAEIEQLNAKLAGHAAALDVNRVGLEAHKAEFARQNATNAEQWQAIEKQWAAIEHHGRVLDDVGAKFAPVWDAIEKQWAAIEHHGRQLDEHAGKFAPVWDAIDKQWDAIEHHAKQLEEHGAKFLPIWEAIEKQWAAVEHHARLLEEHGTKFAPVWEAIEKQWAALEHHSKQLDEHGAKFSPQWEAIEKQWAAIGDHTQNLEKLWAAIEKQWKAVEHHGRTIEKHWDALSQAEKRRLEETIPELQRLQTRLASVEGRQHDAEAKLAFATEFRSRVLEMLESRESGIGSRESGAEDRGTRKEAGNVPSSAFSLQPSALSSSPLTPHPSPLSSLDDLFYLQFQKRFRGDEDALRKDQSAYAGRLLPHLKLAAGEKCRSLDVACGDGILVDLLAKAGWDAHGVDINAAFAAKAREKGLAVDHGDAFEYLRAHEARSWNVVSALQFVEHLDAAQLTEFVRQAHRVLKPGGLLLVETLNPNTLLAHKWFQLDLTHRHLVFPQLLEILCETTGLVPVETQPIHEPEKHERLEIPAEDGPVKRNAERLNALLFGAQDYYLIARKPV